jgi:hypothetical protein
MMGRPGKESTMLYPDGAELALDLDGVGAVEGDSITDGRYECRQS